MRLYSWTCDTGEYGSEAAVMAPSLEEAREALRREKIDGEELVVLDGVDRQLAESMNDCVDRMLAEDGYRCESRDVGEVLWTEKS